VSSVGAVIAAILSVSDSAPGRGRDVCRYGSIHESAEKRGWECVALGPSETHFAWGSDGLRCIDNLRNRHLVIGISSDPVEWHRNFAERDDLPFTLLSDEGLR
jgi:hypothetical protein